MVMTMKHIPEVIMFPEPQIMTLDIFVHFRSKKLSQDLRWLKFINISLCECGYQTFNKICLENTRHGA